MSCTVLIGVYISTLQLELDQFSRTASPLAPQRHTQPQQLCNLQVLASPKSSQQSQINQSPSNSNPPSPPRKPQSKMSDSSSIKQSVMKQVLAEANLANARVLIEKLQENCFEKCVPKPGSSLSSSEQTCMTSCMEKYMAAWNQVNAAYINRIRQEQGNN
ncbi:hypothetical protein Trisim1_001193 [Trichoderma cf. simile WF8]